jgi:hypothetical protein
MARPPLIERLGVDPGCCLQPSQFLLNHGLYLVRPDRLCGPAELLGFPNPILRFGQVVKYWPERASDHTDDCVLARVFWGHAWFWSHLATSLVVPGAYALDYTLLSCLLCSIAPHNETPLTRLTMAQSKIGRDEDGTLNKQHRVPQNFETKARNNRQGTQKVLICGVEALAGWLCRPDWTIHRLLRLYRAKWLRVIHRAMWNARSAAFRLRQRNNPVIATGDVSRIQ